MDITLIVITVVSLILAGAMSFVAWRVVRGERLRSEARVAALAAEIQSEDADLPLGSGAIASAGDMFACVQPAATFPRLSAVVVAGALVVGAGAAILVAIGRTGDAAVHPASSSPTPPSALEAAVPAPRATDVLELVALGHERENDRLTVRGVVRNPANGLPVNQLTAVVLLFNRDGGFLASGRALVPPASLEPGGETTFLVTVPGAADVGRYRVSFRAEDRIISHVDVRS